MASDLDRSVSSVCPNAARVLTGQRRVSAHRRKVVDRIQLGHSQFVTALDGNEWTITCCCVPLVCRHLIKIYAKDQNKNGMMCLSISHRFGVILCLFFVFK